MTDSEDIRATTSKEVRSEMNPLTMDRLLCSIEALATTVARQDEKDRRRQEEDRKRQERTERMMAEVIAVSRESKQAAWESERRTMETLQTVLDRQGDLEAEMYSVDEWTAYDSPNRGSRPNPSGCPVDFRQKSALPLNSNPPSSEPQDDFRPPILRRSERLRRLRKGNTGQPDRESLNETFSDLEITEVTDPHPGTSSGHKGQYWAGSPVSLGLAPEQRERSSKWNLPRGSQFHAAGDGDYLDDDREGSLGHNDPRGGLSKPIGRTTSPTFGPSRDEIAKEPIFTVAGNRLRSSWENLLQVPRSSTRFGDCSFSVSGPTAWTSLPDHLKNASSLETFKSQLKTYLF